jgi:ABC-type glycerol-3-phosphate transport system permease component
MDRVYVCLSPNFWEAFRTIPVGLAGIVGQYQVDWGLLLAGATIATLPVCSSLALLA